MTRNAYALAMPPETLDLVLEGCGILNHIVSQARGSARLCHDDILALKNTVGHLERGPTFVNGLLRGQPGIRRDQLMGRPLRGNPMSCKKLRKRCSDEARWACHECQFSADELSYPNPLAHGAQGESAELGRRDVG